MSSAVECSTWTCYILHIFYTIRLLSIKQVNASDSLQTKPLTSYICSLRLPVPTLPTRRLQHVQLNVIVVHFSEVDKILSNIRHVEGATNRCKINQSHIMTRNLWYMSFLFVKDHSSRPQRWCLPRGLDSSGAIARFEVRKLPSGPT